MSEIFRGMNQKTPSELLDVHADVATYGAAL